MRNDVKIGLVLSLFAVILAGWFFMRRDNDAATVPVATDDPGAGVGVESNAIESSRDEASSRRDSSSTRSRGPMTRSSDSDRAERRSNRLADRRNSRDSSPGGSASPTRNPSTSERPVRTVNEPDKDALSRSISDVLNRSGHDSVGPRSDSSGSEPKEGTKSTEPGTSPTATEGNGSVKRRTTPAEPASKGGESARVSPKPESSPTDRHRAAPSHRSSNGKYEVYTVGEGDTLAIIAEAKMGKQKYVDLLLAANPGIDPARLTPGTKLVIPLDKVDEAMPGVRKTRPVKTSAPAEKKNTTNSKSKSQTVSSSGRTYTVQKGDSFWKIAEKELGSGVRWPDIFELNKDVVKGKAENLRPGQVLRIPEKTEKAK